MDSVVYTQARLEVYIEAIEAEMRQALDALPAGPAAYAWMLSYALGFVDMEGRPMGKKARGKRIRPMLLLLCAEAAGGGAEQAMPAAAAVELLHNFSLIHDDIQDMSKTRRGRPAVWAVWGTAQAINAGDAMYTLAYHALHGLEARVRPAAHVFIQTCLALTLGQHMDIAFESQTEVSVDAYMKMIGAKSAALIAASAELGALIAGAGPKIRQHYADFGRSLGLAFQIRDDILGIWGDETATGKPTGADIRTRKKTLPVIYALARSQALRDLYSTPPPGDVEQAILLIEETGARTYAESQEQRMHGAALTALMEASPAPEPADALNALASRLLRRAS